MIDGKIVLCYLLFAVSDIFADLINPLPQNQAVLRGSTRIAINCSSSYGWRVLSWNVMLVGESIPKTVATGDFVYPNYSNTYEVSQPGNLTSTLIIKTVSESSAGTYSCSEGGVNPYTSQLIVYNSDPVCTSNASSLPQLYQGQSVQMSCSFNYTASNSSVGVDMVWTKGTSSSPVDSSLSYTTTGTLTRAVSTIIQIAGYSNFSAYHCQTSFKVTGNNALNAPTYSNRQSSDPVTVFYFNPNCSINGANSGASIYVGTTITCQADAFPPPTYRWSDGANTALSDNSTVQISKDGEYRCTARNNVSSCQMSINLTTYTTTLPPTTTTPTTTAPPPTSPTSKLVPSESQSSGGLSEENKKIVIGVVVGVGGAILLILLIVIICCCIKKKKNAERYKQDRNVKQMADYPPPYDGHVGPQRTSSPDVVDYTPADQSYQSRSSYGGASPAQPYVVDDGLNYAQIQLDNQPRSRQPLQMPQNTNYVEVALA